MAENSSERAERRVWTAGLVDEQTATVRVLGPGQDAAATALAGDLLQIAEQALQDRPMAERIVTAILRNQSQLVTTATRAVTPGQREAAQEALARAVRRAVLDALPPVIQAQSADRNARNSSRKVTTARKLRPVQGQVPLAKAAPDKVAPSKGTPEKDTNELPVARVDSGKRRRGLTVVLGLLAALVAGFALWYLVLQPTADEAAPSPATAVLPSSSTSLAEAEALQLEAVEPSGGPLRSPSDDSDGPSTTTEATPSGPGETDTVAALDPGPTSGGFTLPANSGDLRIFIHFPEGDPAAAEANDLYTELSRTGELPLVVLRDVGFDIASPRIRYFYTADAEAARALADFLDAPNGGWTLQDFSHIRPLPLPGTVEIYVPSP